MRFRTALLLLLASGCGRTEECKQLEKLSKSYEKVWLAVQGQSGKAAGLEKRASEAEQAAKKLLADLAIDDTDDQAMAKLEARAAEIKGAKATKHLTEIPSPAAAATGPQAGGSQNMAFEVVFPEKDPATAWAHAVALMSGPPLFSFETLLGPDPKAKKDAGWRLQLRRPRIGRVEINPQPQPTPTLDDPDQIASQLGNCGAGAFRKQIATMKADLVRLAPTAARTTVLLPTLASWEGLKNRTLAADLAEKESRRLAALLVDKALAKKLHIRAVGYQEPLAVLEVEGGAKERAALELAFKGEKDALKPVPGGSKDVVRVALANDRARNIQGESQARAPAAAPGAAGPGTAAP
jgi:hypothetical protein